MNRLKLYLLLFILTTITAINVYGQEETIPKFPGEATAFNQYITKNLKYPDVAATVGLTGKVFVRFVIEKDGSVTHVIPYKCLGAGCESEAVRVISMSPKWNPGTLYGKLTRVEFSIPITFTGNSPAKPPELSRLRQSKYAFLFYIKGNIYTIDEAENLLGKSFDPTSIETVENYENPKYAVADKKGIYLIVMR